MRQEEVINKVRELRDEALSLKNVTEFLCTPDDQQTFARRKSGRVVENADAALAYLDNLNMYYGGEKDLGDVKDGLLPDAFAKEEFGPETVNKAFRAYEDSAYMKFARNESEGLAKAVTTPDERDVSIMDMGLTGQCYNDILHDPAYVNGNEVFRLHLLDESYKKESHMRFANGYGIEKTSAEKELRALAHKKEVQDAMKRLCLSRRAQDGPRTKESLMEDYKYIYARLIADLPGTKQTAWQLGQLNELCTLVGGKDRKKELEDILKDVKVYKDAGERYQDLQKDVKHTAKDLSAAMTESIGLGAGPRYHGPVVGRIMEFRRDCMKDINEHLLRREQQQIMSLARDFEEGRNDSAKALCAYVLAEPTRKPLLLPEEHNLMPDQYKLKSVLTATHREGDSAPKRWPLDEVMKAMRELVPFAPHKEIQTAALRNLRDTDIREDYRQFQKSELRKACDRAFILKNLREGNIEPLRKRVEFLLDDLSPDNLRRKKDKMVRRAGDAVRHTAAKTIETFKESANKFLPGKMKFQTNSRER